MNPSRISLSGIGWRQVLAVGVLPAALALSACQGQQQAPQPTAGAKTTAPAGVATTGAGASPVTKSASPAPGAASPVASPTRAASPVASPTVARPAVSPSPAIRPAVSPSPSPSPMISAQTPVTVTMEAQNDSNQEGLAILTPMGNRTRVTLNLRDSPAGPQPAHIHDGTCDNLNPAPRYPLTNVQNGQSTTEVDVPITQLLTGRMAINVHKSPQEAAVYVSCGTIPMVINMQAQNNSGQTGQAWLTPLEGDRTRVQLMLRASPAGPQPAHIHEGTCANLNPAPKFPLENVMNGMSETEVDVSLQTILSGRHAINVHKSPQEASVYVSCGDIMLPPGVSPSPSPSPANRLASPSPSPMVR